MMESINKKTLGKGKVITVASGKGGTGKTTSVAALSSCLAVLGYKTLCIDFDVGMRNLDLSLAMQDFAVIDFVDVATGRIELMSAVSKAPMIPNLFFLTAPPGNIDLITDESEDVSEADNDSAINITAIKRMFEEIRENFDYCLIDAPPGIGSGLQLAVCDADTAIIVTAGEDPTIRDAQQTAAAIRNFGVDRLRLLVNRVDPKKYKIIKTTIDDIIDIVGVQLIGVIREDKYIFRALHANTPLVLYKKRQSAYDYLEVAHRIIGDNVPLQSI